MIAELFKFYKKILRRGFKPNYIVSHLRIAFNQWSTPRRFGLPQEGCPFRCGSQDNSLEHCLVCTALQTTVHSFFKCPDLRLTFKDIIFVGFCGPYTWELQIYVILYAHLSFLLYNMCSHGSSLNDRAIMMCLKQISRHCGKMHFFCRSWHLHGIGNAL